MNSIPLFYYSSSWIFFKKTQSNKLLSYELAKSNKMFSTKNKQKEMILGITRSKFIPNDDTHDLPSRNFAVSIFVHHLFHCLQFWNVHFLP